MPAREGLARNSEEEHPLIKNEEDEDEDIVVTGEYEKPYPKCVFFILGNEFCERYSYYGMRTILVLYLKYYLLMSEDTATAIYHAFTVLAYLFPLLGAFVADSWWGKYKTILYLSVVYSVGMILNTIGAIPTVGTLTAHTALSCTGLIVIALGTGGIKPCVSSFGGDQFEPEQETYRRSFFSLFYFAINAGSLVSTIVSPIIRDDVNCFGRSDCYALAFGIPAGLMIIAIITFVIGTPYYKIKAPEGNIFAEVFKGIGSAIKHRWNTPRKLRNKEHWMDYALVDTSAKMVRDTKYVLRVLLLYVPLPLFWTLFDQQGSRWTLQATRMNGYVGSIRIKPDQMQVFNPLLIVTLIPLFEATLYPCLRKYNINFSPLRKMTLGMLLAGVSFVLAAGVQLKMDETLTKIPETTSQASFRVINSAQCSAMVYTDIYPEWSKSIVNGQGGGIELGPGEQTNTLEKFVDSSKIGRTFEVEVDCIGKNESLKRNVTIEGKATWNFVVSDHGSNQLKAEFFKGVWTKSEDGGGQVRVFNSLNYMIQVQGLGEPFNVSYNDISIKRDVERKEYTLDFLEEGTGKSLASSSYYIDTGGDYTIVIKDNSSYGDSNNPADIETDFYVDVNPNDVNIFWMIPQYFVITLGEVFLSVTGLEFSYSQAPTSMKSVLASFWLLTVSLGNIIVLIIAEAKFVPSQADEYFLFAGLIGVAALIFIGLAIRYEYVDESEFYETEEERIDSKHLSSGFNKLEDEKPNGASNGGFKTDDDDFGTSF